MIKVQNQFNKLQNSIIHVFYYLLRIILSVGLGFISSQCIIFEGFSPFSLILLSISPNIGMIPTFCYLGCTFGTLFNPFDLSTFKYVTALTMVYVIYMIFQKSLHVIKRDTAVLTAACCFTSGFLFLLVGQLTLFNVLVLIGESVLICCCIFFINYATKAFRRCCYLSAQELIAVAITLILVFVALGNLQILGLNVARILGASLIFLAIYCLKTSHTIVLGTIMGIILAAVTDGGEAIFTSVVIGTLAGCVFSSFSERFSAVSYIIVYYAMLFFFGKFPWNYWYFAEPLIAYSLIFFIPKKKLRTLLSSYIAVKTEIKNKNESIGASQLLLECSKKCRTICPKAEICYTKNEPELVELISGLEEQFLQTGKIDNIEDRLSFCIKKSAMKHIIDTQFSINQTGSLDDLIERLDKLTKEIDQHIENQTNAVYFHEDEETHIVAALNDQGISVKDISFITDGHNQKRCSILFYVSENILYEKIIKETLLPYFPRGIMLSFKRQNDDILLNAKDRTAYSLECSALCKTKYGEQICGDQAVGFTDGRNKYYLLLADGMGSGKEACTQSELIINILKKMIKGGLSISAALNTYRSIIRINEPFAFSTIDICSIDLNSGHAELYKAGAFDSFLLSKGRCFMFTGGGVPIGLTNTDCIKHETIKLHSGDYLILASDGLMPENGNIEPLLIQCIDDDVKIFAKNLLRKLSETSSTYGDDDITVMICKFKKTEDYNF